MCRFFETIKLKDGVFYNLHYHSERMNKTRKIFFNSKEKTDLELILKVPKNCKSGIYKCRVEYENTITKIEIIPYKIREIKTLQIIHDDEITYQFKYSDRSCFEKLKSNLNAYEILVVKKGLITDTTFSNIIFFDGNRWITPSTPLLEGTKRKELLKKKIISEQEIKLSDLKKFSKAKLINAMIDIDERNKIEMKNILTE
jgi:4-amino-4-deoxychorismate lyase